MKWYKRIGGNGGEMLHRVKAEQALGKTLPVGSVIHHADGTKHPASALVICQDAAYHKLLHVRMRVVRAGGDPNTDKICGRCRTVKPLEEFNVSLDRTDGRHFCCRECHKESNHVNNQRRSTTRAGRQNRNRSSLNVMSVENACLR